MNSTLGLISLISLLPLITVIPTSKPTDKFNWSAKKGLIAFGDSYTYIQGTHGHQNYSFIGDQLNDAYDAETLLSDMIVQNQTATAEGGPNWVEYLTNCGAQPSLTSPRDSKEQLWDLLLQARTYQRNTPPPPHLHRLPSVNQITQYETYGHKTLTAIWIGINDINDSAKYPVSFPDLYTNMTGTLFTSIDTLYTLGYRSFLFLNLPPLDRTPGNQASTTPHPNSTQVDWYKTALEEQARRFAERSGDLEVRVFDAHAVLSGILDEPARYGIVNTTSFCPGYDQPDIGSNYQAYGWPTPLETYFWFNSGHMTSHVHRILAAQLEWLQE